MSCPDVDDAVAADKHDAAWLASRGCKNLDPGVKQWVVVKSGSETRSCGSANVSVANVAERRDLRSTRLKTSGSW
jgi:hypothetical protein